MSNNNDSKVKNIKNNNLKKSRKCTDGFLIDNKKKNNKLASGRIVPRAVNVENVAESCDCADYKKDCKNSKRIKNVKNDCVAQNDKSQWQICDDCKNDGE